MHTIAALIDEPVLAEGLQCVLAKEQDLFLISVSGQFPALLTALDGRTPLVLILGSADLNLELIRNIRSRLPSTAIVLWTRELPPEIVFQALELGVRGVLRRTLPSDICVKCLRLVAAGEMWLERSITEQLFSYRPVKLSPREAQLVKLLGQGLKNKEISAELQISEGSVKIYLSRLYQKLGTRDRLELALFGLKNQMSCRSPRATDPDPSALEQRNWTNDKESKGRMRAPRLPVSSMR